MWQKWCHWKKDFVVIERTEDFEYFIENKRGIWNTVVCRDTRGSLLGFLGSVDHPASRMIGPGVAENEQVTMELLATLLNRFHGKCPVFLPVTAKRQCKPLTPGVPEIAKSIFPSVAGKINRPRGLSCQPSCLKLGNLILYTRQEYQTNRAFPCQTEPQSHRVQEIPPVLRLHNPSVQSGSHPKQSISMLTLI